MRDHPPLLARSETDAQGRRAMRGLYLNASAGLLIFLIATLLA